MVLAGAPPRPNAARVGSTRASTSQAGGVVPLARVPALGRYPGFVRIVARDGGDLRGDRG